MLAARTFGFVVSAANSAANTLEKLTGSPPLHDSLGQTEVSAAIDQVVALVPGRRADELERAHHQRRLIPGDLDTEQDSPHGGDAFHLDLARAVLSAAILRRQPLRLLEDRL